MEARFTQFTSNSTDPSYNLYKVIFSTLELLYILTLEGRYRRSNKLGVSIY